MWCYFAVVYASWKSLPSARCLSIPPASQAADYNLDHAVALFFAKNDSTMPALAAQDPFAGYVRAMPEASHHTCLSSSLINLFITQAACRGGGACAPSGAH